MHRIKPRLAALALLAGTTALPALASGSASSASSEGSSASVGSLSTSVEASSDASSKDDDVAQGDYRIIEVADAPARPGTVRLTLHALAAADAAAAADTAADTKGTWFLYLPRETADGAALVAGGVVSARERPYGLEFAQGEPRQAFFLVLRDDWYQELRTRPVTL